MRWVDVRRRQPKLAALGERLLAGPGVALAATLRQDGSPRVTPIEPLFWGRELWFSTALDAWKAVDLRRDPRILLHNAIASPDGNTEYKIRGRAIKETDRAAQQEYATAVDEQFFHHLTVGEFHLFRIDVSEIAVIRYDGKTSRQYTATWPDGGEFSRELLTDTALAPPEPHAELLE